MCPFILLRDSFPQNVIQIMILQRLLELALPRRIDPLAYDNRPVTNSDTPPIGRHDGITFFYRRLWTHTFTSACHSLDVRRSRSTASPDDAGTYLHDLVHRLSKMLRIHVIKHLSLLLFRKPRVRLHDNRYGGVSHNLIQYRHHLLWPHPAVDTEGVHPKPLQQGHDRQHISTCQKLASLVKDHRCEYRKIRVLFYGQNGRFHFIRVAHRLYMDEIGAGLLPIAGDLFKGFIGILKCQIAHRLEQLARRSDIKCSIGLAPVGHAELRSFLDVSDGGRDDIL